jgi:hypothetical protein
MVLIRLVEYLIDNAQSFHLFSFLFKTAVWFNNSSGIGKRGPGTAPAQPESTNVLM